MKLPKELREKKELSTTEKNKTCSVHDCKKTAIRSFSENSYAKYVEKAGLKIVENKRKKIYLCKEHYNKVKKVRKAQEKLYQKKGFLEDSDAGVL